MVYLFFYTGGNLYGIVHAFNWGILILVLTLIASGKIRIDLIALTGLLLIGIIGKSTPEVIFSGFGHPALITIISIFIISEGIVNSGALRGLGQLIEQKVYSVKGQILSLSLFSSFLSFFMNNVGAVGLLLPTAVRMADRKNIDKGLFGLPLALASVIGGSVTLIGSAPNIIVASYMYKVTGESFKMFDFAFHGLAMMLTAIFIWIIFDSFVGYKKGYLKNNSNNISVNNLTAKLAPFNTREKKITISIVLVAIVFVSMGLIHPALGFGGAGLILIISKVLSSEDAYQSIDLKIVLFLGAMLGIGEILEQSSSIGLLSNYLTANIPSLDPLLLIIVFIFISSALSNAINNSAAAVFMAPIAFSFSESTTLEIAAALMAVAAGANLTLILPTHQAVLMVQSKAPFRVKTFISIGILLTLMLSLVAGLVINLVWQS